MTLTTSEIHAVVDDIAPRLQGGEITQVDQPAPSRLIFHIHNGHERYWLQMVAASGTSRLHLLTHRPPETEDHGGFCKVLRQHLCGSPIIALRQVPGDRVVILEAKERDALLDSTTVKVVGELIGTGSNIILMDENDQILGALHREDSDRRVIQPGATYSPLPPPPAGVERASENRFSEEWEADDALSLSRAIEQYYSTIESEQEFEERRSALLSRIEKQTGILNQRLEKLREEKLQAENAEELKRKGELLKIAIPDMERGQETITVPDIFEQDNPETTIELDPKLSPQENIQKYFEEYKRRRDSLEHVEHRIHSTLHQIEQLRRAGRRVEKTEQLSDIEDLKNRLQSADLLPPEGQPQKAEAKDREGPRQFTSRDDMEILVARNSKQNHELTFTISRGNDYWVHLLGWPSPHVIIRKPRNTEVPRQTLLDAAHLAVYFSKIRGTDYAEVVYTQRKYVNPIKGADPGRVRYSNETSLRFRVSKNRLKRLLRHRNVPSSVK